MNPFDAPPSTPAVSYEPPRPPKRRRGRVIGAAVVGVGLVGAAAIGASALVSADDPESDTALDDVAAVRTLSVQDDQGTPSPFDPDEDDLRAFHECMGLPWTDAPFTGDELEPEELPMLDELLGEDFSLDELFGEDFSLDELFGAFEGELPMFDEFDVEGELPMFDEFDVDGELLPLEELFGEDFSLDELFGEFDGALPMFEEFEPGGLIDELDDLVALMGPDGPVVIDLGDGDGSVTIERDGNTGDVTVTTDGGATEIDLDELVEEMIVPMIPDDVQSCLDDLGAAEG